jgi:hypothetical protein
MGAGGRGKDTPQEHTVVGAERPAGNENLLDAPGERHVEVKFGYSRKLLRPS